MIKVFDCRSIAVGGALATPSQLFKTYPTNLELKLDTSTWKDKFQEVPDLYPSSRSYLFDLSLSEVFEQTNNGVVFPSAPVIPFGVSGGEGRVVHLIDSLVVRHIEARLRASQGPALTLPDGQRKKEDQFESDHCKGR